MRANPPKPSQTGRNRNPNSNWTKFNLLSLTNMRTLNSSVSGCLDSHRAQNAGAAPCAPLRGGCYPPRAAHDRHDSAYEARHARGRGRGRRLPGPEKRAYLRRWRGPQSELAYEFKTQTHPADETQHETRHNHPNDNPDTNHSADGNSADNSDNCAQPHGPAHGQRPAVTAARHACGAASTRRTGRPRTRCQTTSAGGGAGPNWRSANPPSCRVC